jgi:hypothetical protein
MNKTKWLKIVNPFLAISVILQAIMGFMIEYLPSAFVGEVHEINAPILVLLVAAHIFLNWGWIRSNCCPKK